MILYFINKRNILLSSASLLTSLAIYNTNRRQLVHKQSSLPTMIWQQSVGQMSDHRNNANSTNNKQSIEWLSRRAHMFDIDIEYLKNSYEKNVIVLYSYRNEDSLRAFTYGTAVMFNDNQNLAVTNAHVVAGFHYMVGHTRFSGPTIKLEEQSAVEMINKFIAKVVYVEKHLDLALVHLYEMDIAEIQLLPLNLANRSLELGESVAILGHGASQMWTIRVGYITAYTTIDTISATNYIPLSDKLDKSELFVVHKTYTIPGNSGSPIIDANYNIIGIHFGSVISKEYLKVGIHYKSLKNFYKRGIKYMESEERRIERDNRCDYYTSDMTDQLGIVLAKTTDDIGIRFTIVDVFNIRQFEIDTYDIILEINGKPFTDISQMTDAIKNSFGNEIVLTINTNNYVSPVYVVSYDTDIKLQVF